jgi:hypothetical protein
MKHATDMRVWWSSVVPIEKTEHYYVKTVVEGIKKYKELTERDLKDPTVTDNVGGLEVFEDGEWCEYYDGTGRNIDGIIEEEG